MLKNERHLARAHLEHRPGTLAAARRMAESGIEKAGIMHPKFTHQRIEWHDFCGVIGRHPDRLARCQDVELVGIEDQALWPEDRLPIVAHLERADGIDIDQ